MVIAHLLLLVAISGSVANGQADVRENQRHHIWYVPHSGIVALAAVQSPMPPWPPGSPPRLAPYNGSFSIYSEDGRLITSVTTDAEGNFTVFIKKGTYTIVPDDPRYRTYSRQVSVQHKEFVFVSIELPPSRPRPP
jgi:hypothetical protein